MIADVSATPISFSIFDVRTIDGQVMPMMCTGSGSAIGIEKGVLRFAKYLRARGDAANQVRAKCFALGLLRDFFLHAWQGDISQRRGLIDLAAAFLRSRRSGLAVHEAGGRLVLRWAPVQSETVRRDRHALAEFAAFCVADFDSFSVLPLDEAQAQSCRADLERLLIIKAHVGRPTELLYHLHRSHPGKTDLILPIDEGRLRVRQAMRSKPHLASDAVRRLIDKTRAPLQKMLLIEAFFGGPRLSEMLHQWRCDIVPGRFRPHLFPDDRASNVPLIILADPERSTYTGSLQDRTRDRSQHLLKYYGRRPRTKLEASPEALGWKGIAFDNPRGLLSQVFWTDLSYAALFAELHGEVQRLIFANVPPEILQSHPYFFINSDPRRREFGLPLKIGNARKTFHRAVKRLGFDAAANRDGSHGARHFYKATLETLLPGLNEDIAKCMHHSSVQSQEDYAKSSVAARQRLHDALQQNLLP